MQRKKMLIAVLAIALLVGAVSAGILTYYGRIESEVTVSQSVLLDDKSYTPPIEEDFDAVGGDVICKYHWLRNTANVPVPVQLFSWGYPEGVTVKYYAMGASETWNVPANLDDANVFNDVEADITKTDKASSIEFKVEIISENVPHGDYGIGIAISTSINTIDFQVWYAEKGPGQGVPTIGWYYQKYPWGTNPNVELSVSGTGITAIGEAKEKIFTVDIPIGLLGGCGAQYYYALQFRTNLLGTWPSKLDLWAQTDATNFAVATVGTEITGPFTLEPGQVLPFYICYEFDPAITPGIFTIYTEVRPA